MRSNRLFNKEVTIKFEDESHCSYKNATVIKLPNRKQLIMTEHCGYFVLDACAIKHITKK